MDFDRIDISELIDRAINSTLKLFNDKYEYRADTNVLRAYLEKEDKDGYPAIAIRYANYKRQYESVDRAQTAYRKYLHDCVEGMESIEINEGHRVSNDLVYCLKQYALFAFYAELNKSILNILTAPQTKSNQKGLSVSTPANSSALMTPSDQIELKKRLIEFFGHNGSIRLVDDSGSWIGTKRQLCNLFDVLEDSGWVKQRVRALGKNRRLLAHILGANTEGSTYGRRIDVDATDSMQRGMLYRVFTKRPR